LPTISPQQHVTVDDESGQVLGEAYLQVDQDHHIVQAVFQMTAESMSTDVPARLVDAALAVAGAQAGARLQAVLPLDQPELLDHIRSRCSQVHTRTAGPSCLLDGVLNTNNNETRQDPPDPTQA
jgi:hypothetical protein